MTKMLINMERTIALACRLFVSTLASQSCRIAEAETPTQSVRYSMQLIDRDPFERPLSRFDAGRAIRRAFNV
jgi:hypothetical protein